MNDQNHMANLEDWTINTRDSWQVLCFCNSLGITKNQLERAIASVGNVVIDVKSFIGGSMARA